MTNQRLILIVEDSDEDFEAFSRAMRHLKRSNPVRRFCDGDEMLDYLESVNDRDFSQAEDYPALMLIDLNLPGTDGRDVIREIKKSHCLHHVPTIALTTSSNPRDVQSCYAYGVNSYVLKPMGPQNLIDVVQAIMGYWLDINLNYLNLKSNVSF
jgi:CheY-like chemotaxis protein